MKMKLIFDMYDFDRDGRISKEDVTLMLSHAPIERHGSDSAPSSREGKITQFGIGVEDYKDRAESQKELQRLVDICFCEKTKVSFEDFKNITEKISSDMFLCLFSLVRTHFPSLAQFQRYEQALQKKSDVALLRSPTSGRRVAAPKVLSKFSGMSQIVKFSTPKLESRALRIDKDSQDTENIEESKGATAQHPYLSKLAPKPRSGFAPVPRGLATPASGKDSPITPAVRLANTRVKTKDVTDSPTLFLTGNGSSSPTEFPMTLFCECGRAISDFNKLLCSDCLAKYSESKCEGYLIRKKKKAGLKKSWYCIDKKEIFCIFMCV
ncbi:MAG: EF-hand domain-containing protein [Acidobacteriaceae bacterium]|nr:EF-hand domain-containing protein [Acidobacteriaceae bacterium]